MAQSKVRGAPVTPHVRRKMNSRKSRADIIFETVNVVLLGIITLSVLYPLWYVIIASFSDPVQVAAGHVYVLPVEFTLDNYAEVFKNKGMMNGYLNSLIILAAGTSINILMTILCAYPLSRKDLWGRNLVMMMIVITMFFGGGLIPTYLLVAQTLHLKNNWLSLILPIAISSYNMIIMRTFFSTSIPYEIQEAASIDGCSPFGTLWRIMLPLSGPVIAVVGLYYGVGHWNSYFNAMIYITDRDKWPLQLFLREVLVNNQAKAMMEVGSDDMARQAMRAETIKHSVIILSSVPMLIIYPFVQKFFVKGVMIGSVKG